RRWQHTLQRGSTSTRSPRSCSRKGRRASSRPGTTSCPSSTSRARLFAPEEVDSMTTTALTTPLRERSSWSALQRNYGEIRDLHLRALFADDPTRGERLAAEGAGLYLDYSKNRATDDTIRLLLQLADESGLADRRAAMFRGDRINVSENRSVLHVALRMPK